ncbi:MAG: Chromosome partition protein Smc, partial [Pseudomonadota bacterium]
DGNSSYFINNQPVRRRDVQDVFLGTGLGPRAYAIIGQGTISRIIESRPEELRLFLEEAAGVSKYKERRRETEHRLSDTRENLTRVDDILRELNTQLEKLEKQAEVAQRYHQLQAAATLRQHQLWYLKRREALADQQRVKADFDQATNALEERIAQLRHVEADLETIRQAHYDAGDQVNQAQGLLYEASAEVGRLEAEIRYVVEGRQRAEQRIAQLREQVGSWQGRREDAQAELDDIAERLAQAQEQAAMLDEQVEHQSTSLPDLEDALRSAQQQADAQRSQVVQVQQQIGVLAAEQRSIDEQSRQLNQRRERLLADRNALAAPDEAQVQALREQWEALQAQAQQSQERLQLLQQEVPELDQARREQQERVNQEAARLADLTARLQALRALQEKVQTDGKLQPWLARHGMEGLQGLWQRIHIDKGWEVALESVLRERMAALQVSRLDMLRALADDAPATKVSFFTPPQAARAQPRSGWPAGAEPLAARLRIPDAGLLGLLSDWLHGVMTAPDLAQALAWRDQLQPAECLVTPQGHVVGSHSLSLYAADSEQAGLLARAQEIEHLDKQLRAQSLLAEQARADLVRAEAAYSQAAQALSQVREQAQQAQQQAHERQVAWMRQEQLAAQTRERSAQIGSDLAEVDAQLDELQERRVAAEARFEDLDLQLADTRERHAQLDERVIEAERRLAQAREQQRSLERQAQEAGFSQRALVARQAELQRMLQTAAEQNQALADEERRAHDELARLTDASAQAGLQQALALKSDREQALGARRSAYDDLTAKLRASDELRLRVERELEPMRQRLTELQLKEQASRLGVEQYTQWLDDAKADLTALEEGIQAQQVRLHGLQSEIDRLNREIQALGAVNLAALDELGSARERKTFLDAQQADLLDAMNTLEDAIRKIDGETRELLGETFQTVNQHFGQMFPQLFGGGQARLVMTGEEILDSGVQVMAQPPGKKNQTIHLLSGGEKALTAIALVFAIFQLNPAPFCLLDEVDAPLDDANTERYARLVTSMSRNTQFLFISHNKIAMEMAEQLIGVTMQEQGVSRIVAVDMESAVSMADL